MKRNYPEEIIDEKFSEARKKPRKEMIYQDRKKNTSQKDKVRLIFTHNRGNPPLHMWLRDAKKSVLKPTQKFKENSYSKEGKKTTE